MYTIEQTKIIAKALDQRLNMLQESERRMPHPGRAKEIQETRSLLKSITMKPLKIEIVECLDGKSRRFEHYVDVVYYTAVKDGKSFGRTFKLNQEKLPEFITKEMLGGIGNGN